MPTLHYDEYGGDWKTQIREEMIALLTGSAQEQQEAYWQIGYHYNYSAPASLYKYYRGTERDIESIKANKMWYSAPCKYNDVFDCEITVDDNALFKCALQLAPDGTKIRTGSPAWKQIRQTLAKEIKSFCSTFESMRNGMGVVCLSESDESLLMWAHYANNHRGMCAEYDLMEINNQLHFTPVPIIYSNDRVCFDTLNPATAENDSVALFIRSITSKSQEWSYEGEWRIIRDEAACGDRWNPEKKGALLDMITPSSITLGCAAEDTLERSVRDYCYENRITLYKMRKDKNQYRLHKGKR